MKTPKEIPVIPMHDSDEYDRMYENCDTTYDRPTESQYYRLFCRAAELVRESGIRRVLEVGCGSGVLAEMIIALGIAYRGFDFSSVAIEKARKRNQNGTFVVGDAISAASYDDDSEGILCCEVLEHIDRDLDAITLWKPNQPVICSVPNFDYYTHVRFFRTEQDVINRYSGLIKIDKIERICKPVRGNKSLIEYLNKVRWTLQGGDWRGALGLLGIRQFDWHGGWFLFTGSRRQN